MIFKLVRDDTDGGRWQWKYYREDIGRWYDYGGTFDSKVEAEEWMLNH